MAYNPDDMRRKVDERTAASKEARRKGFEQFMSEPLTKMALAMVPSIEGQPELMQTILHAAYEAGFNNGAGDIVSALAEHMLKKS